jgi:hypothetical protein
MYSHRFPSDRPPVSTYAYANQQLMAYDKIRDPLPPKYVQSFETWKNTRIDAIIRSVTTCSKDDAKALGNFIPKIAPQTYLE